MIPKIPSISVTLSSESPGGIISDTQTQECGQQQSQGRKQSVESWSTCVCSEFPPVDVHWITGINRIFKTRTTNAGLPHFIEAFFQVFV